MGVDEIIRLILATVTYALKLSLYITYGVTEKSITALVYLVSLDLSDFKIQCLLSTILQWGSVPLDIHVLKQKL